VTNPMERSAAWSVLLEQGKFEGLTGNADIDMTTKFLDDFHASGATHMWEFGQTWSAPAEEPAQGRVVQAVSHDVALDALRRLDKEAEL
jgi:hypothetical protein